MMVVAIWHTILVIIYRLHPAIEQCFLTVRVAGTPFRNIVRVRRREFDKHCGIPYTCSCILEYMF
jgi:hypothetical protein